ncbi:hypothetical protein B5X24_HaOG215315 [Helicoverpa armigera]|uniref:THAP-type domain-containing protein n=1 Tax=Helicoverpa armigera TaxID=29058 RepID=A0A2W1BBE0_HELAM|nr:hypothetical protein B5X24_HaOG215315 [Helicoverpa armigera]
MSSKRCCVPQCSETLGSQRLHWFPNPEKDIARFRIWVHTIGGEILSLSNEDIYKLRRVCHAHFEEKFCCLNRRISNIAIPTLLIPDPLSISKCMYTDRRPFRAVENLSSTSKGVLHKFPNPSIESERFKKWVQSVGDTVKKFDDIFIYNNRRVCRRHFAPVFHYPKNRLSKLAIPTLFIEGNLYILLLLSCR